MELLFFDHVKGSFLGSTLNMCKTYILTTKCKIPQLRPIIFNTIYVIVDIYVTKLSWTKNSPGKIV